MTDNQSSTLKSYVDSATGTLQSTLGSLTGNTGDQVSTTVFHLILRFHLAAAPPLRIARAAAQNSVCSVSFALFRNCPHGVSYRSHG